MDTHKFGKGTSWEHRKLVKNSIIPVTVDDLRDGLVVVSFSYEDKMYQGVLLQLNRERGIPSGISFPKDYFSGSEPNETEPQSQENDPTLIPALPQRHTYFQEKEGPATTLPGSSLSCSSDTTGLRSRVGLRRFIKPPARFKNSRMSLRLRNRPVLCAKCRAFCEEKGGLKPLDKKKKNTKEEDTDSKKGLGGAGGVTTRNRSSSTLDGVTTSTTTATANSSTTSVEEPPQDYSFVSYGTKDFIENYWKRPTLLPEPDKPKKPDRPTTLGEAMVTFAKSVPKLSKFNPTASNVNGNESCSGSNSLTITNTSSGGGVDKTVKIKKSKSLKICVSKLAVSKPSLSSSSSSCSVSSSTAPVMDSTSSSTTLNGGSSELHNEDGGLDLPKNLDNTTPEYSRLDSPDDKKEEMGGSTKMWENRIRKKSVVPARFRDETYLTKKVFGFKRRRRAEDIGYIEESEASELNGRVLPCDELVDEISKDKTAVDVDFNKLSPTEPSSSSSTSSDSVAPPLPITTSSASSSSIVSSSSHTNNDDGHDQVLERKNSVPAKAKTPVIKISFGAPGNGVIVEIPRKETATSSTSSSSDTITTTTTRSASRTKKDDEEPLSEKAARRAMKKAKKEAKRKCSTSKEPSPPLKHASISSSSSTSAMNIPFNSHSQTPSPPTLNPEYPVFSNCDDELDSKMVIGDQDSPPLEPLCKTPKKKKKEKKRKRHKGDPKENDQDDLNQDMQSPSSISPPIKIQKSNHDPSPSPLLGSPTTITPGKSSLPLVPGVSNPCPLQLSPSFHTTRDLVKKSLVTTVSPTDLHDDHPDMMLDQVLMFHNGETSGDNNPTSRTQLINSSACSAEHPQRVCISLKRLCENSYVSCESKDKGLERDQELSTKSSNNHELCPAELEQVVSPPPDSEINDFPINDPLSNDHHQDHADSLLSYTDESNSFVYRTNDIIWGKVAGSPWWPGKILDILRVETDVTARVSWFRASTLSRIRFSQLRPFTDHFDARYARSRKRGSYQLAVRDALIEAHQLDQNGARQLYPND